MKEIPLSSLWRPIKGGLSVRVMSLGELKNDRYVGSSPVTYKFQMTLIEESLPRDQFLKEFEQVQRA